MPQLRKDIISGRWVIVAAERSKRPDDFRPAQAAEAKPAEARGFCPFCVGNESKTPPEVYALRAEGTKPDEPGWRVRVVPNKFPALNRGPAPARQTAGLLTWMEGVGVHEVVIENPDHDLELADLDAGHIRAVLKVFQDRIGSIEEELHYRYVQVFKNKGKEAGASLSHPHSQIVATPIVPKRVKEEIYGAGRLFRHSKECVFCRIIREETAAKERLVYRNDHVLVKVPFAGRFPFEMRVVPLRHEAYFSRVREEELDGLADALKTALTRLKTVLADPPFNLIIHQAPNPAGKNHTEVDVEKAYHWHIEILPVLTRVAGFEWGTGFYINPVAPETAAQFLRVGGSGSVG
ncbi:MAG: galactose-1-phosphate uridylyltransferase [Candidatus Aminicenantes bacterium]|nr:galactose-1-phosphate uridylyltransferase [Candidatus Aminicenantes bacterium]